MKFSLNRIYHNNNNKKISKESLSASLSKSSLLISGWCDLSEVPAA